MIKEDLTGKTFGEFKVLSRVRNKQNKLLWLCVCSCGTQRIKSRSELEKGIVRSCTNCTSKFRKKQGSIEDLVGKQFGHLKVTSYIGRDKDNYPLWYCLCFCGNYITCSTKELKTHKNNSCGCVLKNKKELRNKITLEKIKKREERSNLLGRHFNYFTVISKSSNRKNGKTVWVCKCKCGKTKEVVGEALKSGSIKSCGCKRNVAKVTAPLNKKINMLTVVEEVASKLTKNKDRVRNIRYVKCRCDCGNYKTVQLKHFKTGKYKSCGCLNKTPILDLTDKVIKNWKVIKQEGENWWCVCNKCGETRLFSYNNLYKKHKIQCSCIIPKIKYIPNFVGESYGNLVVTGNISVNDKYIKVKCSCICGNNIITTIKNLKTGALKDCGCTKINKKLEENKQLNGQIINRKFGRLLVISKCAKRYRHRNIRASYWMCLCNCGKSKIVNTSNLLKGNTKSCGCLQFEVAYQGVHFGAIKQKERNKIMNTKKYKFWRREVLKRDNSTCQICSSKKNIVVHHLLSFSKNIKHRFNLNNGIALCTDCHNKFHEIYTSTNFNINNFIEFKNSSTTTL